jgi:acetyltransferase-like isoleucine patch superfamily enzyme
MQGKISSDSANMMLCKLRKKLARFTLLIYGKARVCLYILLSDHRLPRGALVQPALVIGVGKVETESGSRIGCWPSPHFLSTVAHIEVRSKSSIIRIGENTLINNGFVAIAEKCVIQIGRNCLIGTRCEIYDSDFHALSAKERLAKEPHSCQSVTIGDDVFVGSNVRILKGVTIGSGSVIANSAVVTRSIPSNCVAAGIPARVVRQLSQ